MDYTTTDPTAVEADIVAERHRQAAEQAANLDLDIARIDYCRTLLAIDGKDADPVLDDEAAKLAEQATAAAADVDRLAAKLDRQPAADDTARIEWLDAFIAQVEREHASHVALAKLADEEGADPEPHVLAQLVCEGAHAAALAERTEKRKPKRKQ